MSGRIMGCRPSCFGRIHEDRKLPCGSTGVSPHGALNDFVVSRCTYSVHGVTAESFQVHRSASPGEMGESSHWP